MEQKPTMWLTIEDETARIYLERLRDSCEALTEEDEDRLRAFGTLIDSTMKYLLMFDQCAPGQLASPVRFFAEVKPTQRFEELLAHLEGNDFESAMQLLEKLNQVANRHLPAQGNNSEGT